MHAKDKNHLDIVDILSEVTHVDATDEQKDNSEDIESISAERDLLLERAQEQGEKIKQAEEENKQLEEQLKEMEERNRDLEERVAKADERNRKQAQKIKKSDEKIKKYEEKIKNLEKQNKEAKSLTGEEASLTPDELKEKFSQISSENKLLKSYLLALKEKTSGVEFFDIEDYEEEPSVKGEGATSSVKIVYTKERRKFAKKELKEFNIELFRHFIQEGEILFLLRHPCIIRIYGINYGDDEHSPSIILSYKPYTLETLIKEKKLNNEQKNLIVTELVLGMRFIHRYQLMHRDLKPSNILLSEKFHVRISDFGLARLDNNESTQTKGVGTLRFMAPELLNREEYSNKIDIYAFGISLIFIIEDKYPDFKMGEVAVGKIPEISDKVVPWVRELIVNCLSMDPGDRPSFDEIFETIKENNFDVFGESKDQKLTTDQKRMKANIESRVLKIEAFEYQHKVEVK